MLPEYVPDTWVIFKIEDAYRVLAGWSGSYLEGTSWRLSSGIVEIEDHDTYWRIIQHSGSVYCCNKVQQRVSMSMIDMYQQLTDLGYNTVPIKEVMPQFDGIQNHE